MLRLVPTVKQLEIHEGSWNKAAVSLKMEITVDELNVH